MARLSLLPCGGGSGATRAPRPRCLSGLLLLWWGLAAAAVASLATLCKKRRSANDRGCRTSCPPRGGLDCGYLPRRLSLLVVPRWRPSRRGLDGLLAACRRLWLLLPSSGGCVVRGVRGGSAVVTLALLQQLCAALRGGGVCGHPGSGWLSLLSLLSLLCPALLGVGGVAWFWRRRSALCPSKTKRKLSG